MRSQTIPQKSRSNHETTDNYLMVTKRWRLIVHLMMLESNRPEPWLIFGRNFDVKNDDDNNTRYTASPDIQLHQWT